MDGDNSILGGIAGANREDAFDVVVRGYNKRQVEDTLARMRDQISGLEERLGVALESSEHARRELMQTQDALREASTKDSGPKPAHEQVSERLSQILRLAAEEADQSRAKAEDEIGMLRRRAEDEAAAQVASARAEAEHIVASTRQTAERELSSAREEARRLLDAAQNESKRTLNDAQTRAERVVADAESRAAAVNEVAGRRLEIIAGSHADAVRRLGSIRELIAGVLAEEAAAGSVMAAVENAAAAAMQKNAARIGGGMPAMPQMHDDRDRVIDLDSLGHPVDKQMAPTGMSAAPHLPGSGGGLTSSTIPVMKAEAAASAAAAAAAAVAEGHDHPRTLAGELVDAGAPTESIALPGAGEGPDRQGPGPDSFGALFMPGR